MIDQGRSKSRQELRRREWDGLIRHMEEMQRSEPENHALSVVTYEQAMAVLKWIAWATYRFGRIAVTRSKQSGKSAARADRSLGEGAL